ncbi:UTP--glucose-1-phosphate uridylyltransferase [Bacillus taeanensis]|uniref:UTP--glucose-1-phosphate uridylyltransferase n=1 Tax=Bacillus taeanensis TaxID=273032 RepID=A0A366XQH8_9BACI|nr:sugar phosphate nucleotidyltransferase [Bacillus taeanensis]RBW68177.1 UTP--glucose-1-phosphate uridylyltransferase [Bacillus taeanensis]
MKIKKAVILAAGLGTRMMPMTKAIPKAMLPVVDRPILDYIVDEVLTSGIEEIAIVVNYRKEVIENHYSDHPNITLIEQPDVGGTASALLQTKAFTNKEPFALCLGDEIVKSDAPFLKQLMDHFIHNNAAMVTGIEETTREKISAYNALEVEQIEASSLLKIHTIVEKPKETPPSLYTSIGRYVVSPIIYDLLEGEKQPANSNELILTDYFAELAREKDVYGVLLNGKRYDIGSKKGWLEANIELGV